MCACVRVRVLNCCSEQAEAQVEWRLLVVEALGGDVDAAEERGLGGHKLQEALETEDRDGDGFVTIDEVWAWKFTPCTHTHPVPCGSLPPSHILLCSG